MWTIFYNPDGSEAGRLEGVLGPDDAPHPGNYTVVHRVLVEDVRAECARRMMLVVGARDIRHMDIKISNGIREATRLLQAEISGVALSAAQIARRSELAQIDQSIEAIRSASMLLESMSPIPVDYRDNKWWP